MTYLLSVQIKCNEVTVEATDIAKAITEYVSANAIDTLVLGAPLKSGFAR